MQGKSSGPEPYLTVEEEEELKQFLVKCSEIGYGKTKRSVWHCQEDYYQERTECRALQW